MDENTNLNENKESTEATPATDSTVTEATPATDSTAAETSTPSFSMPTDPASTEADAVAASDAPVSESGTYNDVSSDQDKAPVTASIDSESYTSDYSTSDNSGSYPASVSAPAASNPYDSTQTTYGTVETSSDFSKGYATASLALGILSIIFACCCNFLGLILGIVGVVLGCLQKPDPATDKKPGMAIAGIICSAIGIVGSVIFLIFGVASVISEL